MGRNSKAEERLGMTFVNRMGSRYYIKEYNGYDDVVVKFLDEHGVEVHTTWQHCKSGSIKNPYDKTVYGVGSFGEPKREYSFRDYDLWKQMLRRCYSGEEKYKTYDNVTVCERWLCFANFLEDLPFIENYQWWLDNENQGIALDKDLKQVGVENKVYSLETVKFVSASENTRERNIRNAKGSTDEVEPF